MSVNRCRDRIDCRLIVQSVSDPAPGGSLYFLQLSELFGSVFIVLVSGMSALFSSPGLLRLSGRCFGRPHRYSKVSDPGLGYPVTGSQILSAFEQNSTLR